MGVGRDSSSYRDLGGGGRLNSSPSSAHTELSPRIVIIGAGFGGLACARALARAPASVLVLDRYNHHCFQPLLYQVATAALAPNDIAWPIRGILRGQRNTSVWMGNADSIDLPRQRVLTGGRQVGFDYLVMATGVTHSYFGHDEWAPFAPGLKRLEDATRIRRRLLLSFERAEKCDSEEEVRRLSTFVVIGGGPTGVELAGAIAEMARRTLAKNFRRIDPASSLVVLLEAGDRVLSTYPPRLSDYAHAALERKGVSVKLRTRVVACDEKGVETSNGRIDAGTTIWAAGVSASELIRSLPGEHDSAGRIRVTPDLNLHGHKNVYVIGDAAAVTMPEDKPVPGIAPAAKQMGVYVARRLLNEIEGDRAGAPFRYRHQGDLATIGRNAAVVSSGGLSVRGFLGWLIWSVAHVYFLIGARNRIAVAFNWLWDYVTFQRSARLILEEPQQRS